MKLSRLAILLIAALLLGCQTQPRQPGMPPAVSTQVTATGELWASIGSAAAQRLLTDGQAYRAVASPNGRWLAVETQRMSRLVVLELFEIQGSMFKRSAIDVSAVAWRQASRQLGVDLEQIERPAIGIRGWDEAGSAILLHMSGCTEECTKDFMLETRVALVE